MKTYNCKPCAYSCPKRTNFDRHLNTKKHKENMIFNQTSKSSSKSLPITYMYNLSDSNNSNKFLCIYCNHSFSHRSGMYRHMKHACRKNPDTEKIVIKEEFKKLNKMNLQLIEENRKFRESQEKTQKGMDEITKTQQKFLDKMVQNKQQFIDEKQKFLDQKQKYLEETEILLDYKFNNLII